MAKFMTVSKRENEKKRRARRAEKKKRKKVRNYQVKRIALMI